MPEIRSLTRQKPEQAVLSLGEDTLTITFDANKVTPHWMDETLSGLNEQDVMSMAKALADVIISWDITDEGQPFPPEAKNIALLSFQSVNQLYEVVCRTAAPSDAEGNASLPSASEPQQASASESPTSPNGSDTSISPVPSAAPS